MIAEFDEAQESDGDQAWDPLMESPELPSRAKGLQLSLFEMFFIVTLAAFVIGIYIYVSRWLVVILAGALIVIKVISMVGGRYAVVGGVVGFGTAVIVSLATCALFQVPGPWALASTLAAGVVAYPVGAIMSELSNDSYC